MTVIRPNSISGINSITAQGGDINVYRADGTKSDIFINNITGVAATFTGNLGVGGVLTYEDVANIDSVGVVTARTDINLGDSIIHIGDTNTKIRFPAADTITAETAGGEALRVDSSQRLLIGTTTEGNAVADKLTINTNSGASGMTIRTANDSNANIFFSDGTSGAAEYAGFVQYAHATDHLALGANGSEKFRIGSAGQFGVGGATYGSSGQVLTSRGNSSSPHWTTPSTQPALMADTWRLITQFINAQTTLGSGGSDWERDDTYGNGLLGTGAASAGMSVSNGYFSFPTTGFYSVRFYGHHSMSYNDGRAISGYIVYTANNFSSSEYATYYTVNCIGNTGQIIHSSSSCEKIFDITDVSNQKFKLAVTNAQNATAGRTTVDTNANRTYVIVTRLGDT